MIVDSYPLIPGVTVHDDVRRARPSRGGRLDKTPRHGLAEARNELDTADPGWLR
jgi:hypothetical protein